MLTRKLAITAALFLGIWAGAQSANAQSEPTSNAVKPQTSPLGTPSAGDEVCLSAKHDETHHTTTMGEIACLRAQKFLLEQQTAVMENRLKLAQTRQKLKEANKPKAPPSKPATSNKHNTGAKPNRATYHYTKAFPPPGAPTPQKKKSKKDKQRKHKEKLARAVLPKIASILIFNGHHGAILQRNGGAQLKVAKGASVGRGWKVVSIDSNGVKVKKDGYQRSLEFLPAAAQGDLGGSGGKLSVKLPPPGSGSW
jgi:type IV pilus biogenesis protein PilP